MLNSVYLLFLKNSDTLTLVQLGISIESSIMAFSWLPKPPIVGLSPQFSFTGEGVEKVLALCFPVLWVQTADAYLTCST